jgi:pimeloyl-ACP methyl ester carboxylesterase
VSACAPADRSPAAAQAPTATTGSQVVERSDVLIDSEPGVKIAVRRVATASVSRVPVVLVHGAGGGSVASFDAAVPGYSLAEDLARAGHAAYLVDVRGWGRSTRPVALDQPPDANPAAVQTDDAARDLAAAVAWVRARERRPVALLGWATGGHWAGMVAATHPDDVSHLVMVNALYGTPGAWSMRARLEDPERPGELRPLGAYALRDVASLLWTWNANIPVDDKASWRDPRVAAAYADVAIASDPTSSMRTPPSVRVPSGPLHDSYRVAGGTVMWSATAVRAATLVVRGGLDFWSRPEDLAALRRDLVHARRAEIVEIPDATHFVFLDRPERGRARFLTIVTEFLAHD